MLKAKSFQCSSLGSLSNPDALQASYTYPADIVLKKRAGWIVACLRNGFKNRTGNLSIKEERLL